LKSVMVSKKTTPKGELEIQTSEKENILKEKVNLWVQKAKKGDREAFDQLVLLYQDRLYHTLFKIVKNEEDALDLSQEAFVRAFFKLSSFEENSSFYTWLFRIGVNLALTFIRKDKKHQVLSLMQLQPSEDRPWEEEGYREKEPSASLEEQEISNKVDMALSGLSEEFRIPLILKEFEGLKYEEIGEILQIPRGTVKSRIFRAREYLKEKLEDLL
ncbi:MAG: sigma-70 family RNA polymerase sigma factor, partial [Planctomycetota bacterium]